MKKAVITIAAGLLISFMGANAFAQQEKTEGLELWWGMGYHTGEVSFQESAPGAWRSLLEFEADGYYSVGAGARYQFVNSSIPKASLSADFYTVRSYDCDVKDTDWLTTNNIYIYSQSEEEGTQTSADVNFGWQISNLNDKNKVDFLLGYIHENYSFEINNVNTLVYDYSLTNNVVLGHAADYETTLYGYYCGIANYLSLAGDKVRIDASLKYSPNLQGEGEGHWELRDLKFKQEGKGDGWKLALGVSFIPKDNWMIGIKLTQTSLSVEDGDVHNYNLSNNYWYGDDIYSLERNVNDLDFIEVDALSTEIKIGYVF